MWQDFFAMIIHFPEDPFLQNYSLSGTCPWCLTDCYVFTFEPFTNSWLSPSLFCKSESELCLFSSPVESLCRRFFWLSSVFQGRQQRKRALINNFSFWQFSPKFSKNFQNYLEWLTSMLPSPWCKSECIGARSGVQSGRNLGPSVCCLVWCAVNVKQKQVY